MKKFSLVLSCLVLLCFGGKQATAAIITTTFGGDNGQAGNMFDITVFNSDLTITGLDVNINITSSSMQGVKIYTKTGSYSGSEGTPGDWTLLFQGMVSAAAVGNPTFVNIPDFLALANSTYAWYITITTTSNIKYTDGNSEGAIFVQNSDMAILEGVGIASNFGTTFRPRIWNGSMYYDVAEVSAPISITLFGLGLAGLGIIRRRKS
jgi:hypothetical protein